MTVIALKKLDDDVIALFPEDYNPVNGCIGSYMLVGQHSEAAIELLDELPDAEPQECTALLEALQRCGYTYLEIQSTATT